MRASRQQIGSDEAGAPIGVLHRIDYDNRFTKDGLDISVVLRREQVVGLCQRRVDADNSLPCTPCISHVTTGRSRDQTIGVGRGQPRRISQATEVGLDAIERRHPLRGADDQEPQRTVLPRRAVSHERRPRRFGSVKRLEIAGDFLRCCHPLARLVSGDRCERGHVGTIDDAGRKRGLGWGRICLSRVRRAETPARARATSERSNSTPRRTGESSCSLRMRRNLFLVAGLWPPRAWQRWLRPGR